MYIFYEYAMKLYLVHFFENQTLIVKRIYIDV